MEPQRPELGDGSRKAEPSMDVLKSELTALLEWTSMAPAISYRLNSCPKSPVKMPRQECHASAGPVRVAARWNSWPCQTLCRAATPAKHDVATSTHWESAT